MNGGCLGYLMTFSGSGSPIGWECSVKIEVYSDASQPFV